LRKEKLCLPKKMLGKSVVKTDKHEHIGFMFY
jgi:hypothetical protein